MNVHIDPSIPLEKYFSLAQSEYLYELTLCENKNEEYRLTRIFATYVKLLRDICKENFGEDYFYRELDFKQSEIFLLAEDFLLNRENVNHSIHWRFYYGENNKYR